MSFDGHVLCQRIASGPCAFAIIGKPSVAPAAATPVAPFRNLRRVRVMAPAAFIAAVCGLRMMLPPKLDGFRAAPPGGPAAGHEIERQAVGAAFSGRSVNRGVYA